MTNIMVTGLLLLILVCQFGVIRAETGKEFFTRLESQLKERATAVRRLTVPQAEDMVEHSASHFIPVQAVSEECRTHSHLLLAGLRRGDIWALRMLDASSQMAPVVIDDHIVDLGKYEQCVSVQEPGRLFSGQHCVVETRGILPQELHDYINWNMSVFDMEETYSFLVFPEVEFMFSVCVPSTCSFQDVHAHVSHTLALINSTAVMYEESCSTKESLPFRVKDWLAMIVFLGIVYLVVSGTLHEYRTPGRVSDPLCSFSLISNWKTLTEERCHGDLSILDGVRVMGIGVVVVGHRTLISWITPGISHTTLIQSQTSPVVVMCEVLMRVVDVYFVLGGTIRAYKFCIDRHQGKPLDIRNSIIRRYIRYTPTLAVVMVYSATFLIHSGSGPLWKRLNALPRWTCSNLWVLGLLHVTNYVTPFAMCENHSWYLSCDFQLFLVSPLFLFPLYFRPRLGLSLLALCSVASLIASFLNSYFNQIYGGAVSMGLRHRSVEWMDSSYFATHLRAPPYLLGMAVGYYLFNVFQRNRRVALSKVVVLSGWIFSVASVLLIFVAAHAVLNPDREFSPWLDPLYISLSKPVVATVITLLLLAYCLGYQGLLKTFLMWKGFQPLAKLVLGVYLVHFNVIRVQVNKLHHPIPFSYMDSVYLGLGDLLISLALALVLYLSVEQPCCRLVDYLLRSSKTQEVDSTLIIKEKNNGIKTD